MLESLALSRLTDMLANSQEPILSTSQLRDLLLRCRTPDRYRNRPDTYHSWAPTTVFTAGERIVKQLRGQYELQLGGLAQTVYITDAGGTSGATEPAYPTGVATVNDGSVIWRVLLAAETSPQLNTSYWVGAYNLNYAAALGWQMKAGLVVGQYGLTIAGNQLQRDQVYTHCIKNYNMFMRRSNIGSISFAGSRPNLLPDSPLPLDFKFGGDYFHVGNAGAPHIGNYILGTDDS